MTKRDTRTPEQRELDQRLAEITAEQERLDETLTRREVVEAINDVVRNHTNGPPESQRIADAFKALAKALS